MTSALASANNPLLVSRTAARHAFRDALRLFVGRGKRFSVKQASNGSGVPDRMIECFMSDPESGDYRKPDLEEALSLASLLGPEFTCEWLHLAHQGAFWLPDEGETPPGAIAADNAEDNAVLTRAAVDGRFDRAERPGLREVGVRMMTRGAHLHRIGRAA